MRMLTIGTLFATGLVAALPAAPTAAQTLCDNPQETCGRIVPPKCLARLGAGSLPAGDDCAPSVKSYGECLALAAETCSARAPRTQQTESKPAAAPADPALTRRIGRRGDVQVAVEKCTVFDVYLTCDFELTSLRGEKDRYFVHAAYNNRDKRSTVVLPGAKEPIQAQDGFVAGKNASRYFHMPLKKGAPVQFSVGFQNEAVKALNDGDEIPELTITFEYKNFVHKAVLNGVPVER